MELSLEEGDVEDGGVVVDELQHVDLEREAVIITLTECAAAPDRSGSARYGCKPGMEKRRKRLIVVLYLPSQIQTLI